jgi:hypothetical protein
LAAPIIYCLTEYLQSALGGIDVWNGEVVRSNEYGLPVLVDNAPVMRIAMPGTFARNWTMADPYDDIGPVLIQFWATTLAAISNPQQNGLLDLTEALLAQNANWTLISGKLPDPMYVIKMLLKDWVTLQEDAVRTQESNLLYRGDLRYEIEIHGQIATS